MVLYLHIILASIHVCLSSFVYTVKPIWSQDFCSVWVRAAQTLTRQVPGLAFLVLGLLMAQHCCAESRCHWDISTQPLSSTHSVPVSLHSECLVVWRFKHLRWGDLRVELEVKWDKYPRNPNCEKKKVLPLSHLKFLINFIWHVGEDCRQPRVPILCSNYKLSQRVQR